jgi:hypothetical protein
MWLVDISALRQVGEYIKERNLVRNLGPSTFATVKKMLGMGSVFGITDDDVIAEVMFFFWGEDIGRDFVIQHVALSTTRLLLKRKEITTPCN